MCRVIHIVLLYIFLCVNVFCIYLPSGYMCTVQAAVCSTVRTVHSTFKLDIAFDAVTTFVHVLYQSDRNPVQITI